MTTEYKKWNVQFVFEHSVLTTTIGNKWLDKEVKNECDVIFIASRLIADDFPNDGSMGAWIESNAQEILVTEVNE